MRFFADESCGQCTPCRVGTAKAVGLMARAAMGQPRCCEELSQAMIDALDLRARAGRAESDRLRDQIFSQELAK